MQKTIYISNDLTSFEYYKSVLPEIKTILKYYDKIKEVIFDFSGTYKIEPNVIPNLLCLGRVIHSLTGYKAVIRIPDTYSGGKLKNYLYLIGFTRLAKNNFEFESDPYTGFEGKKIDPLCGTIFFDEEIKESEIERGIDELVGPFAERYLKKYNVYRLEDGQIENNIENLLKELAANAASHGESYSYTTVHAKYSIKKIFIAISDSGIGFWKSCQKKHREELEYRGYELRNEVEAILYCIYMRKGSQIFGLYAVIYNTIKAGGIVRIHSNNAQVIFTPRILTEFESQSLLKDRDFWKCNVKRGLEFSGTHIEIEIPF